MKRKILKKKKIIIICICILILLMIILISSTIFFGKTKNKKVTNDVSNSSYIQLDRGRSEEGQLVFSGASVFVEKYNGEIELSKVLEELEKVVKNRIPKTYNIIKDYDENDLEIFFNNNKKSLKNMYGIQTVEEFIELAEKLQGQNVDFNKYLKLNINSKTFTNDCDKVGYSYVEANLEYEDGTIIPFIIYISQSLETDPNYIIKIK